MHQIVQGVRSRYPNPLLSPILDHSLSPGARDRLRPSTSDFCLHMRKIKWRRLQICRSCHRARRAPRRGGWRRLFVHCEDVVRSPCCSRCATFTIYLQAWWSAGRDFFCASWVERCDKTPIHTKDTLRVAPLRSCVMDSQGRATPRS